MGRGRRGRKWPLFQFKFPSRRGRGEKEEEGGMGSFLTNAAAAAAAGEKYGKKESQEGEKAKKGAVNEIEGVEGRGGLEIFYEPMKKAREEKEEKAFPTPPPLLSSTLYPTDIGDLMDKTELGIRHN